MIGFQFTKTIFLVVNFFILLFLLKKFFFKPVVDILDARKEKIKEGLAQREIAKQEQEAALKEREKIIAKSRVDSKNIIKEAEKARGDIIAKANEEAKNIIEKTNKLIAAQKEKMKEEMNLQLIELLNSAAHSVLPNLIKQDSNKKMVENIVLDSLKNVSM